MKELPAYRWKHEKDREEVPVTDAFTDMTGELELGIVGRFIHLWQESGRYFRALITDKTGNKDTTPLLRGYYGRRKEPWIKAKKGEEKKKDWDACEKA